MTRRWDAARTGGAADFSADTAALLGAVSACGFEAPDGGAAGAAACFRGSINVRIWSFDSGPRRYESVQRVWNSLGWPWLMLNCAAEV